MEKRVLQSHSKKYIGVCHWGRWSDLPFADFIAMELRENRFSSFFFFTVNLGHKNLKEKVPNIQ